MKMKMSEIERKISERVKELINEGR